MMTGDQLIAAVKRRCFWPRGVDKAPFTDAEILAICDEELVSDARPMVVQAGGEFDLAYKDYTIVSAQARYRLPSRMYDGVRDVVWVDSSGQEFKLGTLMLEDVPSAIVVAMTTPSVRDCRYYLDGDFLHIHPAPTDTSGTLRVKYALHPSALVKTTSANVAIITGFTYAENGDPPYDGVISWTAGQLNPDGVTCDVVSAGNAHSCLMYDFTAVVTTGDNSRFEWPFNPSIVAGDYLCRAGYTPIVQLPDAALAYFVRQCARACLEAADDEQGAAREFRAAEALRAKALGVLKPRNKAEPTTITTRNSPLRVSCFAR